MIIDKEMYLSKEQAITASAPSANTIDQGVAGDAYGNELFFVAKIGTAFSGTGTLTIAIQTATDTAFTAPITLYATGALALASLTANTFIAKVRLPLGTKRYIRAYYTVASGTMTAGTIDAFFTPDVEVEQPH